MAGSEHLRNFSAKRPAAGLPALRGTASDSPSACGTMPHAADFCPPLGSPSRGGARSCPRRAKALLGAARGARPARDGDGGRDPPRSSLGARPLPVCVRPAFRSGADAGRAGQPRSPRRRRGGIAHERNARAGGRARRAVRGPLRFDRPAQPALVRFARADGRGRHGRHLLGARPRALRGRYAFCSCITTCCPCPTTTCSSA